MDGEKKHTSIPPGIAAAAAYFIPFLGGLVMLAIEEEDRFVRFNAAQAILFWVCVLVLAPLSYIPVIKSIFAIVFLVAWIFLMYQAWMHREFEIPYLGEIAKKQVFGGEEGPSVQEKPAAKPEPAPEPEEPAAEDEGEGPQV